MKLLSLLLALGLYLLRWKKGVLETHLSLLPWPASTLGRGFRFRWCLHLSQDLLDSLLGTPVTVQVRARDRSKLQGLKSQPSLFLTGHFHNWEALAAWLTREGVPLLGAARPLASPLFHRLLSRLRRRHGVPVVTKDVLARARSHLRNRGCFGVLWDQYSPLHRHTSSCFGVPAAMDPLPEILVRRLGPAVMAGFLLPDGTLRLVPLLAAGSNLSDPARLSQRYHRVLETVIRAHPTYWYGLCHARFKDSISYPGRPRVSRETLVPPRVLAPDVSRETAA